MSHKSLWARWWFWFDWHSPQSKVRTRRENSNYTTHDFWRNLLFVMLDSAERVPKLGVGWGDRWMLKRASESLLILLKLTNKSIGDWGRNYSNYFEIIFNWRAVTHTTFDTLPLFGCTTVIKLFLCSLNREIETKNNESENKNRSCMPRWSFVPLVSSRQNKI